MTVFNRIERISAEIRKIERNISGLTYDRERGYRPATADEIQARAQRSEPRLAELRDQVIFWHQVRKEQIAAGIASGYDANTIKKGDAVKIRGRWVRVARANPKTVTVQTPYSWTDRYPWVEVQDHRPAK